MFLSPGIILKAYEKGLFPMSESFNDPYIHWVYPTERGIIELEYFRLSKSLKKVLRKDDFTIKVNTQFEKVINLCARNSFRQNTWINNQIIDNYIKLFSLGRAKSVEYFSDNKLLGGLYGLILGNIFCGESMFSLIENSSKVSMVYLAALLKQGGYKFIDTQFYSEHLKQFGTKKIKKYDYDKLLKENIGNDLNFPEKLSKPIFEYF